MSHYSIVMCVIWFVYCLLSWEVARAVWRRTRTHSHRIYRLNARENCRSMCARSSFKCIYFAQGFFCTTRFNRYVCIFLVYSLHYLQRRNIQPEIIGNFLSSKKVNIYVGIWKNVAGDTCSVYDHKFSNLWSSDHTHTLVHKRYANDSLFAKAKPFSIILYFSIYKICDCEHDWEQLAMAMATTMHSWINERFLVEWMEWIAFRLWLLLLFEQEINNSINRTILLNNDEQVCMCVYVSIVDTWRTTATGQKKCNWQFWRERMKPRWKPQNKSLGQRKWTPPHLIKAQALRTCICCFCFPSMPSRVDCK